MKDFIVTSTYSSRSKKPNKWDSSLVGHKALGLQGLPSAWTPPFIVITTDAYERWREDRRLGKTYEEATMHWLIKEASLDQYIIDLSANDSGSLIVRSSTTSETLRERGRYESKQCSCTLNDVLEAIFYTWSQAERILIQDGRSTSDRVALIIQPYIVTRLIGHLSNERRISREKTSWVYEFEVPTSDKVPTIKKFKVRDSYGVAKPIDLACENQQVLKIKLRDIASISSVSNKRYHYEWVWDGYKLWIVQRDTEEYFVGSPPASEWEVIAASNESQSLAVLVEEPNVKGDWPKIESVRTFKACGLPTATVFVLEDSFVIERLLRKEVDTDLLEDFASLLKVPIVIRSDIKASAKKEHMLLPRTDLLRTPREVSGFLVEKASYFQEQGLKSDEFCFIIHRFILARAGAFSLSLPNDTRVRIDSTWGSPDGLLFYPHDSFEIDLKDPGGVRRRVRGKTEYIDADSNGDWVIKPAGAPWDWRSSLRKDEILWIAKVSHEIAIHLKKPVGIMLFVGIDPKTGYTSCLPWYYTLKVPESLDPAPCTAMFTGRPKTITDKVDLQDIEKKLKSGDIIKRFSIRLKPKPGLLRSKEFVEAVAKVATQYDIPVELEGSILQHIYYMLYREGVKVRCLDAFNPEPKKQRFGKLVRDLIPLRIQSKGEKVQSFYVTKEELIPLLKAKAIEEALELFWESDPDKAFEELADLLEVVESTCHVYGRGINELRDLANAKREDRGGFEKGVFLVETSEVPLMKHEKENEHLFNEDNSNSLSEMPVNARKSYGSSLSGRKPKSKNKNVIIPLIPPDPIELKEKYIIIPLQDNKQEIVIEYSHKEILIKVRPTTPRDSSLNQLRLF